MQAADFSSRRSRCGFELSNSAGTSACLLRPLRSTHRSLALMEGSLLGSLTIQARHIFMGATGPRTAPLTSSAFGGQCLSFKTGSGAIPHARHGYSVSTVLRYGFSSPVTILEESLEIERLARLHDAKEDGHELSGECGHRLGPSHPVALEHAPVVFTVESARATPAAGNEKVSSPVEN